MLKTVDKLPVDAVTEPNDRSGAIMATLPTKERKKIVEQIRIDNPRLRELETLIADAHESWEYSAEPECLFIKGRSGVGKSTLFERYECRFPRVRQKDGTLAIRVFRAKLPTPATIKSVVSEILAAMGDPAADRGNTANQTRRLRDRMEDCRVELLMLDEFQHVIDPDSEVILKSVSNWLKSLIDQTKIPVVLSGLPRSDIILESNEQLDNRFGCRETLDCFRWETKEGRADFRRFLESFDNMSPFREDSGLSSMDLAARLFFASGGILRPLMRLLRRAARAAIDEDAPSLARVHLAVSFERHNQGRRYPMKNPFAIEFAEVTGEMEKAVKIAAENEDAEDAEAAMATNRRVKSKTREITSADILRR